MRALMRHHRLLRRPNAACHAGQVEGGRTMNLRVYDEAYLGHVDRWWNTLLPKIAPYLYHRGGPILMTQVGHSLRSASDTRDCDLCSDAGGRAGGYCCKRFQPGPLHVTLWCGTDSGMVWEV